jgi:hypothetical protein
LNGAPPTPEVGFIETDVAEVARLEYPEGVAVYRVYNVPNSRHPNGFQER